MKNLNRFPIIYFAVFILMLCGMTIKAQVTWNGDGGDMNWHNSDNWDMDMVPIATDDVIIPAGFMVVIRGAPSAVAGTLSLTQATLTIENGGSLNIDGSTSSGDAFRINESVVTNSGIVTVTNSNSDGIFLDDGSVFTNNGTVSIENSDSDGLELDDSTPGSTFINNGILNLTNDGSEAILMENNAFFRNSLTGVINIENDEEEAIHLDDPGAEFINEGDIFINSAGDEGIELDSETSFTNTITGYILILLVGSDGSSDECAIDIDGGSFINDGIIEIDGGDKVADGIDLSSGNDMPGTFMNNGHITINDYDNQGIDVRSGSTFTNTRLGNIQIFNEGSDGEAIEVVGATFINDGTIEIDGGSEARGIGIKLEMGEIYDPIIDEYIYVPGTFVNNWFITIENIQGEGIDIDGESTFTNNLMINVGLSVNSIDTALIRVIDGSLINSSCGVINMTSNDSISILVDGSILNEGVITTIYTGFHFNEGLFTNNGEIATPDGNFNIAPNQLVPPGSTVTMGDIPRQPSAACLPAIPTMGEWALGILALLMVIFGLVWMRSRQLARSS